MRQFAARQFVAPPSGNDGAGYGVRKAGLPLTPAPYRPFGWLHLMKSKRLDEWLAKGPDNLLIAVYMTDTCEAGRCHVE